MRALLDWLSFQTAGLASSWGVPGADTPRNREYRAGPRRPERLRVSPDSL